ncbi:DUF349 domain-containing protein [Belliella kenyensis]|uniref:DUF349 domain-containing protein n=1 Tax=Belliella kenyensis TaxID=1472724 RepID=A0ABV8EKQ6_9BACT|nr:DUF349 domain-containing protein [Belliella kenyensis]MCH7400431.1 DUF349 domain-containing protein [Belliella kenyensis]MDN3604552.1 DUF349 domain-containing protein [Belliella kenyensis]
MSTDKEMSEEDKVTQAAEHEATTGKSEISEPHNLDETTTEEHHEDNESNEELDYSSMSKEELLASLKTITSSPNFIKSDSIVNDLKSHYDEFFNNEKEVALKDFLNTGGVEDDFEYRRSNEDSIFYALVHDFKTKRADFFKEQERQKEKNLYTKNLILDKLRDLVDGEETTLSINAIKQIQEDWKSIGQVPAAQNKSLWASYNALMDRFYDNRSIYFELKELDRKKNLEQKLEICEKAEALIKLDNLAEAIKSLNDLHEEFKHVGPVPREEQEALWNRFKTASDTVYGRRKEYFESQKGVYLQNLELKKQLIEKLEPFKNFHATKIKEWNIKTKEVLAIQKEWEAIGPIPKEEGREVNKDFWGTFKQFFHNKNLFFKELDEIRAKNKEKAEELIAKAEDLVNSTEWQETANKMISLQQEWRNLGPTPEKFRDQLYSKFKKACDTFFDNRRSANKAVNKEFEVNLVTKEALCAKIKEEAKTANKSEENLEKMIHEFNAIGFVPRKNMKDILTKFNEAVDFYVKELGIEGGNKDEFLFRLNLNKLQSDPNANRTLNKKEHGIRKQISDLENNITLWKNNLEFFADSKTADKLKDQFDDKIKKAEAEIDKLKKKLSIIREF